MILYRHAAKGRFKQPMTNLNERFLHHGFHYGMTGGSCTAYIRVCPDGSEIWITTAERSGSPTGDAPTDCTDRIFVGTYERVGKHEVAEEAKIWIVTDVASYLDLLDAIEVVLGPLVSLRALIEREIGRLTADEGNYYDTIEACYAMNEIADRMKSELGYDAEQDPAAEEAFHKATAVEILQYTLQTYDRLTTRTP